MPVAVALKRLVTARALFALLFAAFFFLSRLVMLTAGTLTALHRVTAAAGREGSTNACVAQAAKTARRKHRMVCEDLVRADGEKERTLSCVARTVSRGFRQFSLPSEGHLVLRSLTLIPD